jgi:hypothetical protein
MFSVGRPPVSKDRSRAETQMRFMGSPSGGIATCLTVVAKTRFEYFMRKSYPAAVIVLNLAIRR